MNDGPAAGAETLRARPVTLRRAAPLDYATPARVAAPYDREDHDLAMASLICGVVVLAPFITGILSVVFGLAVLRRGERLRRTDLALAAFGTAVGAVQLSAWTFWLVMVWWG